MEPKEEQKKAKSTTVSIPTETATKIDKYIEEHQQFKAYGRSGIIACAIDYLERTGADIMGDYTIDSRTTDSLEDLKETVKRLESGYKEAQEQSKKMFFSFLSSQKMLCDSGGLLPSAVDTALAVEKQIQAENELQETKIQLEATQKELLRVKRELTKFAKLINTEL